MRRPSCVASGGAPEYIHPQRTDRLALGFCRALGQPRFFAIQPESVLHAAQGAIRICRGFGMRGIHQAELSGDPRERDVAEVGNQLGVRMGIAQHQVLDDELEVDQTAGVVLDLETRVAAGVLVEHLAPHRDHFFRQLCKIARAAQQFFACALELGADLCIAGDKPCAGERLVFPQPRRFILVLAERIDAADQQARFAVGAQPRVGVEQRACGGARR